MPIADLQQSAKQIANFLNSVIHLGGLRLKYRISASAPPESAETGGAQVLNVELAGPDAPLLTQRGGELLRSLEHIAIQILRLDVREHDLVSFDALNFKALRAQEIQLSAETAAERVRQSGQPFSFPPSNSRERRMLHLAFKNMEDVESASVGEGQERYLVVYPKGKTHLPAPIPTMPSRSGYGSDRGNRNDRGRGDRPRRDSGYRR
ncbi:Jag family protein [Acidicapsa acidisoli]|uniref:Jag family protein n=1 Tax=Acidicapsa acidisoli TaxID=1615681 RepID=UPI0021E0F4BE|nr:R3H domain-containing nucleic acid-binding protein [Acidicapsa acidisoli]